MRPDVPAREPRALQLIPLLTTLSYRSLMTDQICIMVDQLRATSTGRADGRGNEQLRALKVTLNVAPYADGSVLIATGNTQVICTAKVEEGIPKWMKEQNVKGGWLTAEYSMLPYSTRPRRPRDVTRGKLDGRSTEIQRLIGRALRAATDLEALGERTIWIDCDVLQADGGTRTASITGASIALAIACDQLRARQLISAWPMRQLVAGVSVGIVQNEARVDLDYEEDKNATVDLNLIMTSAGEFVEVQGAGEEATFSTDQLSGMIQLGRQGIERLIEQQREVLRQAIANPPNL
jgi:ribonuclease PH